MAKGDLLDPTQQHTLSERECEIVAMFRIMTETEQKAVLQAILQLLITRKDKKNNAQAE